MNGLINLKKAEVIWMPLNNGGAFTIETGSPMDDDSDGLKEWMAAAPDAVIRVRVAVMEKRATYRNIWEWTCDGTGPKRMVDIVNVIREVALKHVNEDDLRRETFKVTYSTRAGALKSKHITVVCGIPCKDCKGTGEYVGFNEVSDCHTCEGDG